MEDSRTRNDLLALADQLELSPEYSDGAREIRALTLRLIEERKIPGEVILMPEEEALIGAEEEKTYTHPLFSWDMRTGLVNLGGVFIDLTDKETEFINFLAKRPNSYVSLDEINMNVFPKSWEDGSMNAKVLAYRVRNKLPFWDENHKHKVIKSKRGVGYMFEDRSKPIPGQQEMNLDFGQKSLIF